MTWRPPFNLPTVTCAAEASTDPRFASFVAEATTHNISYHSDGSSHGISYIPPATLHPSPLSPPRSLLPAAPSPKKSTSSHAKVAPRKRKVADVHWDDAAADALHSGQRNGDAAAAVEQPAQTLASIVDIDAFLACVHKNA